MEKYAPSRMELAPRDIVARAEQSEMDAGRGVDGKDIIHLDLDHFHSSLISLDFQYRFSRYGVRQKVGKI